MDAYIRQDRQGARYQADALKRSRNSAVAALLAMVDVGKWLPQDPGANPAQIKHTD